MICVGKFSDFGSNVKVLFVFHRNITRMFNKSHTWVSCHKPKVMHSEMPFKAV